MSHPERSAIFLRRIIACIFETLFSRSRNFCVMSPRFFRAFSTLMSRSVASRASAATATDWRRPRRPRPAAARRVAARSSASMARISAAIWRPKRPRCAASIVVAARVFAFIRVTDARRPINPRKCFSTDVAASASERSQSRCSSATLMLARRRAAACTAMAADVCWRTRRRPSAVTTEPRRRAKAWSAVAASLRS